MTVCRVHLPAWSQSSFDLCLPFLACSLPYWAFISTTAFSLYCLPSDTPQWGTADAEIKNPLVGAKGYQMFPRFKPGVGI